MKSSQAYILAAVVVLLLAVAYAYETCKFGLNQLLPAKWQKTCPPPASGFVGAFGRAPGMENCHAWDNTLHRRSDFNRCTWA